MLDEKMEQALNDQLNAEMASGYLYLSMATYLEDKELPGFANSLRVHAEEELEHAMKFYDYILRKDGSVVLQAIDTPKREWDTIVDIYKEILEHEELVTSLIHELVDLSIELKDHATNQFLQWFVEEQVEEEELAHDDLRKVKMSVDSPQLLYLLDEEYGQVTNNSENASEE
ncbi:MAG: ferritin [Methanosphaera sp.]|jgi:ferritin|uniref:ferritin n=1 Tax=Methanosphaera TaxID=2316 RepID=UPI002380A963|nr:ferritin [Candidatus Methanosphaera massiliense]MDD6286693.1 ferritin [Methanobacteriaceae archaeon]MDE4078518.1 ferritin [Candidatus Methanosphaera massiliense]MDY2744973.1 ferritin [Methanosphaera sp.]